MKKENPIVRLDLSLNIACLIDSRMNKEELEESIQAQLKIFFIHPKNQVKINRITRDGDEIVKHMNVDYKSYGEMP